MRIKLKVTPNSSKNQIMGWIGDSLKIKIAAQAKDGKANKELIKFLAEEWDIAKNSIIILKGTKSRNKILEINSVRSLPLPPKPQRLL